MRLDVSFPHELAALACLAALVYIRNKADGFTGGLQCEGIGVLGSSQWSLGVEGALNRHATSLQNVGVDHGGFDVFVTEELLDRANIVAV